MPVIKNILPCNYENEDARKKEIKRIYLNIQRSLFVHAVHTKKTGVNADGSHLRKTIS